MQTIKKHLLTLIVCMASLLLSLCFVACDNHENDDNDSGEHVHTFSMWSETTQPTCTQQGMQTRTCATCGFTEYSPIPALGHNATTDMAIAPTCTANGKTDGSHCNVCGEILVAQNTVIALGHNPIKDMAISPTCIANGKTEGSHCNVCGRILVAQNTITAKGHTYDDGVIVTQATCSQQGTIQYTCSIHDCNDSYTEPYSLPTYSATELYEQSIQYVGEIIVYDKKGVAISLGTGFVYSTDGEIITNYHVIDGAYSASITINNVTYPIDTILAYDENIDLAILKVNGNNLTAAKVCKSPVKTGETVYAIGSSRGLTNTYSQGIVTYANRVVDGVTHIQHDASITNGNSGGPLINVYGEVIGINTWGVDDSQNLNFAVFTSELDNLVYQTPKTLVAFYEENNSAYDVLLNWLSNHYDTSDENGIYFHYTDDFGSYSLAYSGDFLCIIGLWYFDDGSELGLLMDLSTNPTSYPFFANYVLGENENTTEGTINATTFTETTPLTYTSYTGTYWIQSELLEFYRTYFVTLIDCFDTATSYFDMGVSIKDLGFEVFEVTTSELSPTDVLKNHILTNGTLHSNGEWYEIEERYTYDTYYVDFSLVYATDTDNVFISFVYFSDDGDWLYTYLGLNITSSGAFYAGSYSIYDGSFNNKNDTHGYINPETFTSETSTLSYISYEGLDAGMATLLNIYADNIKDILDWLTDYLSINNLGITIAQLGFTAY